jgi:hypothetical protein
VRGSPSVDCPSVRVHSKHLQQLFQNLIGNGIKYGSHERSPVVHIAVEQQNGHRVFSVNDNGIGIAPEYKEKILGFQASSYNCRIFRHRYWAYHLPMTRGAIQWADPGRFRAGKRINLPLHATILNRRTGVFSTFWNVSQSGISCTERGKLPPRCRAWFG